MNIDLRKFPLETKEILVSILESNWSNLWDLLELYLTKLDLEKFDFLEECYGCYYSSRIPIAYEIMKTGLKIWLTEHSEYYLEKEKECEL